MKTTRREIIKPAVFSALDAGVQKALASLLDNTLEKFDREDELLPLKSTLML